MIDMEKLERRPLSNLFFEYGYRCSNCNTWKLCYYSTRLLDGKLDQLKSMRVSHPSFRYHLVKEFKRSQEVQERVRQQLWQDQT